MDDITRVCRKCGQEKPLEEFAKNKECVLGHSHICKQCKAEQSRKWHAANFEKARENNRKRRAANPEKYRERSRKYRAANPEKIREYNRKYREELSDGYLIGQLKHCNLPVTPETIDYKRIHLKLYQEIKNQQNDERD
jgi:putative uncharacterized protein C580L